MQEKELLRELGEGTLYSAKGHFKACDTRRVIITITIWSCAILNVIALLGILSWVDKIIAVISLLGLISLLIWNEGEGKKYRARHKVVAEKYLSLHKEARALYFLNDSAIREIEVLSNRVMALDQSEKPDIHSFARKMAKRAIEKKGETDKWFLK